MKIMHYEAYIDPKKNLSFSASQFLKNTIWGSGIRTGRYLVRAQARVSQFSKRWRSNVVLQPSFSDSPLINIMFEPLANRLWLNFSVGLVKHLCSNIVQPPLRATFFGTRIF